MFNGNTRYMVPKFQITNVSQNFVHVHKTEKISFFEDVSFHFFIPKFNVIKMISEVLIDRSSNLRRWSKGVVKKSLISFRILFDDNVSTNIVGLQLGFQVMSEDITQQDNSCYLRAMVKTYIVG